MDHWYHIASFIRNDKDKCKLMLTCKQISKYEFYFYDMILIDKIGKSIWFNKFTNILIYCNVQKLPLSINKLTFDEHFNSQITMKIPPTITHLSFGTYFQKSVDHCIPTSVIELTFGDYFGRSLENIPSSVITLNFHIYSVFGKFDKCNIPDSIRTINFIYWDIYKCHNRMAAFVHNKKNISINHRMMQYQDIHHYPSKREYIGILQDYAKRYGSI